MAMMLPIVQPEYRFARIGIESQSGSFDIKTHQPVLEVKSTPAQVSAPIPQPELDIDQSRMWAALNGGKPMQFWSNIYSQMPDIALEGIRKIVERGNRMGDLRIRENPIPDIALEGMLEGAPDLRIYGPATADNIDFHVKVNQPNVQVEPGTVDIQAHIQKPDIQFHRGNVRVYMEQYPELKFNVMGLDVSV